MSIFGAYVPVSGWTVLVMLLGGAVSVLFAPRIARRRGWRQAPAVVTALLLTAVASVTLTPGDETHANGVEACLPDGLSDLVSVGLHSGGGVAGNLLNVVLMFPFAGAVVVTTGRILPGVVVSLAVPMVVELVQSVIPGRFCSVSDLLANVVGGLVGVALGHVLLRQSGRVR
ncbi:MULTISPECIES: VanZ family protein [Amycolatopsis]|uniref:VanZ family protein n=1 Tax=Amycolatopsis TaxID=1813 RepID=UPI00339FD331